MLSLRILCALSLLACASFTFAEDIKSGPAAGKAPELKVFDTTGPNTGSEVDYTADRKGKPTIYVFIVAEKFDRPVARFVKQLDTAVAKESDEGYIVAVWITEDEAKTKAYLPIAQSSLKFERSALTFLKGGKTSPKDWNIDTDVTVTAVVANDGKVIKSFGYRSVNDSDVPAVQEEFVKALKKK